jgi:hypothetical protein
LSNSLALANIACSIQDLTNVGIYTITVTFTWGGLGAVTSLSVPFTLTLLDPCQAFLTPPTFAPMVGSLLDPNQSLDVLPTISSTNYMYCLVSIQMTVSKNAAPISDGFVSFTDVLTTQLSLLAGPTIVFNLNAYIANYIGVYSVSLLYSWSGPSSATQTFTFTVLDPCIVQVVPPSIPSQTLQFSSTYLQPIQPLVPPLYAPYCNFDIAVTKDENGVVDLTNNFVSFTDLS